MGIITVHYRDVNHPNQDINKIALRKPEGTAFNVKDYTKRIPMRPRPYYFCNVIKSTSKFTENPQDVIIFVRAYLRSRLVFKDIHTHKIIANHYLYAREVGKSLDYIKLGRNYMPAHYQLLTPAKNSVSSNNSSIFIPGVTNVIYIQKIKNKASSHSTLSHKNDKSNHVITGRLYYVDVNTGDKKKVVPIHGAQDQRINYSRYQKVPYLPNGYTFDRLGDTTGSFLEPHAKYSIMVKRQALVTGTVLYQDASDNSVKKMKKVTGHPNQSITNYLTSNSKYIPNGYHLLKVRSQNGSSLKDHAMYIVLIQRNQRNTSSKVTGFLNYRDQATGQVVKQLSINGSPGMSISVNQYIALNHLPHGYRYDRLGSTNWHLKAGRQYYIWVRSRRRPQSENSQDSTNNHSNSATINSTRLKQTYHNSKINLPKLHNNDNDIGSILMALGSSLSALGSALTHKENENH